MVNDRQRRAFTKWLAVAADDQRPYTIRLAAIRAVVSGLPARNPLRAIPAPELFDTLKQPGDTKLARTPYGRFEQRPVSRPPESLADLW
jgi:hypothetical protein